MFGKARSPHDISRLDSGGPTACEARLESGRLREVSCKPPFCSTTRRLAGLFSTSAWPNTPTPLKSFIARPSQKLRRLNTALIMVGVLRGSTWRAANAPAWNTSPVTSSQASKGPLRRMRVNVASTAPADETTSLVVMLSAEFRLRMSANW
jgi:hypothetical protein